MTPRLGDSCLVAALAERARNLAVRSAADRVVIGVAGSPGAGKSTLVDAVVAALRAAPPTGYDADWVAHLPMDGFHLADVQLDLLGLRERKGAPETFDADGYVAMLERVHAGHGRTVYAPGFERTLEQPLAGAIAIAGAARLVLTEGNYLLLADHRWAPVRRLLDESWFVSVDGDLRRERLVSRHLRFGKDRDAALAWVAEVDEPNAELVEASRAAASLVLRLDDGGATVGS